MAINWKLLDKEVGPMDSIVDRVMRDLSKAYEERQECEMDLTACHLNGCRLDLVKLLFAPPFDFAHDIYGIRKHIDRKTGKLEGFFLPRCAAKQ